MPQSEQKILAQIQELANSISDTDELCDKIIALISLSDGAEKDLATNGSRLRTIFDLAIQYRDATARHPYSPKSTR